MCVLCHALHVTLLKKGAFTHHLEMQQIQCMFVSEKDPQQAQ